MSAEASISVSNERRAATTCHAVTSAQFPILLDQLFLPDKPIANTGTLVWMDGALDADKFAEAVRRVVEESDLIRVQFRVAGDSFTQEAVPLSDYRLRQFDVSAASDPEQAARNWIAEHFRVPLRWDGFPLFDLSLIKLGEKRFVFVQKFNHAIIDATGRHLLFERVAKQYENLGGNGPCAPIAPQLGNRAAEERAYLESEPYREDAAYWERRLQGTPEPLIHADRSNSERAKSGCPRDHVFSIAPDAYERLQKFAAAQGSSLARIALALSYVAFTRFHGVSDLVLGFPFHNRTTELAKRSIGLFMQVVPFRFSIGADATFRTMLREMSTVLSEDRRHSRFPLSSIPISGSGGSRRGALDVVVNYVPAPPKFHLSDAAIRYENYTAGFFSPWAVDFREKGDGEGATLSIVFDPGLLTDHVAAQVSRCLHFLLTDGLPDADQPIGKIAIVTPDEQERLLAGRNEAFVALEEGATLASLCAEQAKRTPNATAVICGSERISYADLHARAAAIGRHLIAAGIGPEAVAGIAVPRSIDLIAAVLAVHKAGGAYLPLDPAYPPDLFRYIAEDAGAAVIVTTRAIAGSLPPRGARLIVLDDVQADAAAARQLPETVSAKPENLAYVIYTSGSTGQPKGVAIEHRNAVNLVNWSASLLDSEDRKGVLFSTPLTFDASLDELLVPLICGGCIILVDNLLAAATAPARDEIRVINAVPSMMTALLDTSGLPPQTRVVQLGGEAVPRSLAERLFALNPALRLRNIYGPTEATVDATWSELRRGDTREPAIGKGIWNTQLYVLDSHLELLPAGATGELYIGGRGVARGYLNKPDLTAERFVANPFGPGRLYRTGDLVRWREDGELEFLGRADSQVKLHGVRIELAEIERRLMELPQIKAAVALLCADEAGVTRLCGYAIPEDADVTPELHQLAPELKRMLPSAMMPAALIWLERFPLNASGKIDRRALPAPDWHKTRKVLRAARDEYEHRLGLIWKEVLDRADIGIDDEFHELGGTSLQAFMVFARIAATFGCDLPPSTMTSAPTIAAQAKAVRGAFLSRAPTSRLVRFREGNGGPNLFVVHGGGGGIMFVRDLASTLSSGFSVYGVQPAPLDGAARLPRDLRTVADDYLREIRRVQPSGPYYLAGYCIGGAIAFEMAQQLTAAGERVGFLGMIDTNYDRNHEVPAEKKSARMQRHLQALGREPVLHYLRKRIVRTLNYHWQVAIEAGRQLPNEMRALLGLPIPYDQRTAYYRRAFFRAERGYLPKPYPGPVVIFARKDTSEWQRARWSSLALGGISVHEIPSGHSEIVLPPYTAMLAACFDSSLKSI